MFFVVEKVANVHFFGQILKISAQICIFCVSVFKDKVKLPRPFTFFTFATYHVKKLVLISVISEKSLPIEILPKNGLRICNLGLRCCTEILRLHGVDDSVVPESSKKKV
jgi:hypothetical protein